MKSGDKIDNYTLLYECGRGAFGTVFLAQDKEDKYVALKAVSLFGDAGDRELQALESYKRCSDHDCLLKIHRVVMKDQYFYYIMEPADNLAGDSSKEYIPCTLSEVLRRQKNLTVKQTTELIFQLLEVLAIIHSNDLVHRDIKPANIFWINKRVKLGDIGLLANENSMTCNAGSQGFMPKSDSPISPNSSAVDLYALTRLIYCCLSGKRVSDYPELDLTDDIFENGRNLLNIMNMSDEEINNCSVKDFQEVLKPKRSEKLIMKDCCYSRLPDTRKEDDSLSSLSALSGISSAESWLKKSGIGLLGATIAGAALVNIVPGVLPLVGLGLLGKKLFKKK